MDETALHLVALAVVEVLGSELVVGLVPCEHVVEGDGTEWPTARIARPCHGARRYGEIEPLDTSLHAAGHVGDFS